MEARPCRINPEVNRFGVVVAEPVPEMSTALRVVGRVAEFVVTTADPTFQDRIVHMGWQPADADVFVRRFAADNDVERIHENFARHLAEMLLQSARLRRVRWEDALQTFLDRVDGSRLSWWLYGSGALAVRGFDVDPGDLDFAVGDAHHAGLLFEDLLVEPVTRHDGWVAEWTGRAFTGALFEWLAIPFDREPHEQGSAAAHRLETVDWRGRQVLVPPLDLQLAVAQRRGLHDRVALIRQALDSEGKMGLREPDRRSEPAHASPGPR
jgi:hypothetical protein